MYQIQIDDMILTVDAGTAEQLEGVCCEVRREITKGHMHSTPVVTPKQSQDIQLWKSPKCPSEEDHQAILALLALRRSQDAEFGDKKSIKFKYAKKLQTK
ncbi:hypothetical protein JTB14_021181 [Gonioctena quinquepunctata]|nr:hypothetical protein JTB14_021181 [Gonioctena quinquepunctata]